MFASLFMAMVLGSGLTELDGQGSMYVFTTMGPWTDPVCREYETTSLDLQDLLDGAQDQKVCQVGTAWAQAHAETRVELKPEGFMAMIDAGGEAIDGDVGDVFSRHDVLATLELAAEEDLRVRVDWSVLASGLASIHVELLRLGNLDGSGSSSPPVMIHSASAYIEPIQMQGVDVFPISQGRWRMRLISTHQAMGSEEGFVTGEAQYAQVSTYVSIGDVDGDGAVDIQDVLALLDQFGACESCQADLDDNGEVEITDLLLLLAEWGT
ncbi:MAG: hypothetical protein CMJ39_05765 [Phycisphaerae bacterium]|nr:hypothetical protein [Phycisphaerae bacterium]